MSENIPSTSSSAPNLHHKRSKRRYDKAKLPTPPPDPTAKPDNREEFLAYLDSLQKSHTLSYSRSASAFAPVMATEDAFDHLEKLYKLMEQMLELRDQNAKLHRKIRDLEHLNNLEKMHQQLDLEESCPELGKDTAFAETILESILAEAKMPQKAKPSASRRIRQSIYRRHRNRSGSVSADKPASLGLDPGDRRASMCVESLSKPAKVSKWTKVKAAFKWEKASPNVSDAKSQDSGLGGMVPVNLEVARYLRVPSTCEDASGHSPADSGAAEISTPGTLSTASSTEDFHHRHDLRTPCEDLRSSDDEHSHNYIPHSKEGSQKSNKSHKTPWAKMKDIIQTRNSFKKKHRLSGHSDDIQIDVELCSDNEEVFEDDDKNKLSSSPKTHARVYSRVDSSEIPPEIIARYQQCVAEDETISDNSKKISKWTRVKKAFLPPLDVSAAPYPSRDDDTQVIQDEIQKNYKQLQKKLSLEFQEKLYEWERMKQNSPGASNPSSSGAFVDDSKDGVFMKKMEEWQKMKSQPSTTNRPNMQLTREENLPPDFRKKLQEWEKIRKTSGKETNTKKKLSDVPRWKSLSGPRSETSPAFEYPPLSEDFRKKLEEWKQIKSGGSSVTSEDHEKKKDIKASPRLSRKNSSPKHVKKHKDVNDKELQWFEKELTKIEKEKQRLERERQKFLEREETLSKLRSSVVGGLKKEVLIHTPCGFYRFEGISRKFTRKLYEWEKAQGIGPESSTFALLNSSLAQDKKPYNAHKTCAGNIPSILLRSKSADSIAISALNLTCPLLDRQPSSLSLNDVEELEKECLADSKSSSMHFLAHSHDSVAMDEPEAIIVEVEDIIEETAAPLRTFAEKTQQAIYQRQELKAMCEGETCLAPKIRRSESARAQNNYNLIEEIFSILKNLTENELEIQRTQELIADRNKKSNSEIIRLKMFDESQKAMSSRLVDKVVILQEANSNVFTNLNKENADCTLKQIEEMLEIVQDLSSEIYQLTEKMDSELLKRNVYDFCKDPGACSLNPITDLAKEIRKKMLDLRRNLSYLCAASDLTAPRRRHSSAKKKIVKKSISSESNHSRSDTMSEMSRPGSEKAPKEGRLYTKSETSNVESQGAIKKRIKYRQKTQLSRPTTDTDDEEDDDGNPDYMKNTHKKLARARTLSETSAKDLKSKKDTDEVIVDESIVRKVVVPTQTNFVSVNCAEEAIPRATDSPVSLFVKTTRKLFTPLIGSGLLEKAKEDDAAESPQNSVEICPQAVKAEKPEELADIPQSQNFSTIEPVTRLPPLPASPTPQRKVMKDISPSIRLMLAKYNQKISEQDSPSGKSGGSSGSNSPVAWRSPSAERRVKAQTERYQEGLSKLSPLLGGRREVQKSASVGFLHGGKQITVPEESPKHVSENARNICKSSSVCAILPKPKAELPHKTKCSEKSSLTIQVDNASLLQCSEIRLKKLQKAKEDFLRSPPASAPVNSETIKFPARNRLSQISVDSSDSSYDSAFAGALIKSASAGMINVDADVYKQFVPEVHGGGYVSLPRSTKKPKEGLLGGKFAFSNIASKFRKVKMRRGKEKDKMNTVSTLCRQSLVVDIHPTLGGSNDAPPPGFKANASSEDVSSSSPRAGSWIKKPKLFKK